MKKLPGVLLLTFLTTIPTVVLAIDCNPTTEPKFIISYSGSDFEKSKSDVASAVAGLNVEVSYERKLVFGYHSISMSGASSDIQSAVQLLRQDSSLVSYLQPDPIARPANTPTDPLINQQWALGNGPGSLLMSQGWNSQNGYGTVVAILDTGITPHEDLQSRLLPGYDFVSQIYARDGGGWDSDPTDPGDWVEASECSAGRRSTWHGTHVAGIAAASANSVGIAGIAPRASILPIRVMGDGHGYASDIAAAIAWAAGSPIEGGPPTLSAGSTASVINLSLSLDGNCSSTPELAILREAVSYARSKGAIVVAAAGNDQSHSSLYSPASCPGVISVAASIKADLPTLASFSNTGARFSAPGVDILSTYNSGMQQASVGNYSYQEGTSQAAPFVTGTIASMQSVMPRSESEIIRILDETADRGGCTSTTTCPTPRILSGPAILRAATYPEARFKFMLNKTYPAKISARNTSADPNGDTMTAVWSFDSMKYYQWNLPSIPVTLGSHRIELEVTDATGKKSTTSQMINCPTLGNCY
ncbi:S8 family serine peptidase [Arenimonas sp.]|uniref:S8 family serine peptidase n=1 Tax=Arenimonas sp. TaxID=1872635 RepID=UPI0035B18973